jgi:hypothetical protein
MCDVVQGDYDHELSITVETGAAALDQPPVIHRNFKENV